MWLSNREGAVCEGKQLLSFERVCIKHIAEDFFLPVVLQPTQYLVRGPLINVAVAIRRKKKKRKRGGKRKKREREREREIERGREREREKDRERGCVCA